jgi:hypothetical protein
MAIDIIFTRHFPEDFPQIKKTLLDIVGDDAVTLMLESNQIIISDKELLKDNKQLFLEIYMMDMNGRLQFETNPALLHIVLTLLKGTDDDKEVNSQLYHLTLEHDWSIRHEYVPPEILFSLQKNYRIYSRLPLVYDTPNEEYIAMMKVVLSQQLELTLKRDSSFFKQIKNIEHELPSRRIISVRGTVHSYMINFIGDQGINFHGNLEPSFTDLQTQVLYDTFLLREITDKKLISLYLEVRNNNST